MTGHVRAWEPPRLLEFDAHVAPQERLPEAIDRVIRRELFTTASGTLLVLTFRGLSKPVATLFASGLKGFLARFEARLDARAAGVGAAGRVEPWPSIARTLGIKEGTELGWELVAPEQSVLTRGSRVRSCGQRRLAEGPAQAKNQALGSPDATRNRQRFRALWRSSQSRMTARKTRTGPVLRSINEPCLGLRLLVQPSPRDPCTPLRFPRRIRLVRTPLTAVLRWPIVVPGADGTTSQAPGDTAPS